MSPLVSSLMAVIRERLVIKERQPYLLVVQTVLRTMEKCVFGALSGAEQTEHQANERAK